MIVVSGGLVVVAIVLLAAGLITGEIEPVYISIAVSFVAGVFLLLGALQRRGETPAAAGGDLAPSTDALDGVGAVNVRTPEAAEEPVTAGMDEEAEASLGEVSVVPGRPRYHVASCRFLAGRSDIETMAVEDAQDDGFTACGVCKPDQVLAAAAEAAGPAPAEAAEEPGDVEEPEEAEPVLALVPDFDEPAPEPEPEAAPARTARKTAATGRTATKTAAAAKTAAAKPAAKATATGTRGGTVVVIPDRDKYHLETCRFVRDVPGTLTVTKATAKRQGYNPCGVCKP